MKASQIIGAIEAFAPLALQEDFDNSGLQVGDCEQDISMALTTMDVTEAVIDEAIRLRAGMVISHHPLLFTGLKCVSAQRSTPRIVAKAIKHDIVIYAAHTNLDKCPGGVNFEMARRLGLRDVRLLVPDAAHPGAGLGCIGSTPEPVAESEYLLHIKRTFNARCIRHSPLTGRQVSRVALTGGSGSDFIADALAAGADIYITADVTYHRFSEAENQLVIADIGHYECESLTKELLARIISEKFPNFALRTSDADINPVTYA